MIASLPMYLRPENRAAHDAYYALIRQALQDHGRPAPAALDHDAPIWATWGRSDLVLGQICNLPYRTAFHDKVTLIGAADHGLPDTEPGTYYSLFVVRNADTAPLTSYTDKILAYNEPVSHSGWAAPHIWAQDHGLQWGKSLQTRAHSASAQAVAEGRADIAAIDAQTWRNIQRWGQVASALKVIGRTPCSPGISYITAGQVDPAPYFNAISQAISALDADDRAVLNLRGLVSFPQHRYLDLLIPQASAQD